MWPFKKRKDCEHVSAGLQIGEVEFFMHKDAKERAEANGLYITATWAEFTGEFATSIGLQPAKIAEPAETTTGSQSTGDITSHESP